MPGGSEERLPDYFPDLPYIATRVSLESFPGRAVPWHWHSPVEMFYMEKGELEYSCLDGSAVFPEGTAGFVNSNVLHASRAVGETRDAVSRLHTTPTEYITSFRLREAADRLIKTHESASNIAYSCGFSSGSYFGKLFRERFGLTPTEYRLEKQKAEQLAE